MAPNGPEYTAALAAADRQYAHVVATVEQQSARVERRIAEHGKTGAWALTSREICEQLDIEPGSRGAFAAEMLAVMLVERVVGPALGGEADDGWPQL